jgi:hypothetical protein
MVFKKKGTARRKGASSFDRSSLKIRILGQDKKALSIQQWSEGMLDAIRALKPYEKGYRIKSAAIYLTMIDERGEEVRINDANELAIYPYASAADEAGV